MKIGTFSLNEQSNEITGAIYTCALHLPYLILRAVEARPDEPQSDRAPVFEIFEPTPAGIDIQIGAVWHRKMRESEDTFLSGMIDDPSFAEPLPIALFGDELKGFDVQWRRERQQQPQYRGTGNGTGSNAQRRTGQPQRQSGGFAGGSTASMTGEYVGQQSRALDDEVPF